MKVWLVVEHIPYEGSEVLAVLGEKEWAEAKVTELKKKDKHSLYRYAVEEWDVGGE